MGHSSTHRNCYNEVIKFHPFPDIIQKISQKEDIYDPNQIAHIGNSKISLLSAYHAQCNWNILLATNEESDWSAYPHTHFIDKTSNLKSIFQSTQKSQNRNQHISLKRENHHGEILIYP
jgi:hypothetical protein